MDIKVPAIFKPIFTKKKRFKVVHGGRGSGKSETIARYLLYKGTLGNERILCTREIQKSLDESVYALLSDIIRSEGLPYRILRNSIENTINGTKFIFQGLKDHVVSSVKSIKGITICWVEEAQTVTQKSLNLLTPSIREEGAEVLFSYNRMDEFDPVHVTFADTPRDDTLVIFANYYDNPYFPNVLKQDMLRDKEIRPNDYLHIWEGQPLQAGSNIALPAVRVRAAMDRVIDKCEGPIEIGVDVAREGKDRTAIVKRHGLKVISVWSDANPMRTWEVASKAIEIAGSKFDIIRVDDTGCGGGVTDELVHRLGQSKVQGINFASKVGIDKDKYPDFMSHMYFEFEKILDEVDLPFDLDILKELSSRRYHYKNANKLRQIENKADFKKRLGKSPDIADALLLACIGKPREEFNYSFI